MMVRLDLRWHLQAPLSHIGDSEGPDSYLVTQDIIGPDCRPVEVFVYSGNAIRGMLRDAGAKYFLDALSTDGNTQVPLEMFYLLFSGGSIGGAQKVDIDQARRIRRMVPHLSIFGGGVGTQILPGKLNVGDAYLLCAETQHLLPPAVRNPQAVSWRAMTTERSYTRTDDAKDENKRDYLIAEDAPTALPDGQTMLQLGDGEDGGKRGKSAKKDAPQQMRYRVEVVQAGAQMWSDIVAFGVHEVELGALVAAFDEWGKRPVLGGKSNVGMGKVRLEATVEVDGEQYPFATIEAGRRTLSAEASAAKGVYDRYLGEYRAYLAEHRDGLVKLIGA